MSIISRFLKGKDKSASLITSVTYGAGFDTTSDTDNLSLYKKSLHLYTGVSMVCRRTAGIPLELYRIKNKKGDVVEVLDHPILALLGKPNSLQTAREFMEMSINHYLLSGDCFWYLDRNGTTINEIVPLRPDRVQVVMTPDNKTISHYEYSATTIYKFQPKDIVHIRNVDPENPLRGIGVVSPARSRIMAEIEATKYQANFFKNQGRPDFIAFADQEVTDEQGNEFRARWKRIFGRGQGGQVAILGSNVKSVQEANKTPKEMDFIESQKFLRDDILAALHVPKAMVTSDDVNLSNAKEAYKMYLQEAVIPVLEAFVDALNHRLLPQVDMNVFFSFNDPTPADEEMKLKRTTELKKNGIITANEGRELYEYEPMEGGDDLSVQKAPEASPDLKAEAKAIIRLRPVLAKKLEAIEKTTNLILSTQPKREMNSVFTTKAMKESYAKAYNERVDKKADILADAIKKYVEELAERVLATDLGLSTFMDKQNEKILARNAFMPIMETLYREGGQSALDALFKKSSTDFFVDEELLASLQARVYFFTDSMTETTFEILKGKITTGITNGDGVAEIAASLREYFNDMGQKRALTIARTETGFALSKATNDAYNQSAIVTGKEWITVGDDKVRDEHKMNDGVIVEKGRAFPSGEHYPAEHSVNCRCVLAPAV